MSDKPKFPTPLRSTREPLPARDDWERHIKQQAYQGLETAGDACRILSREHPDLRDSIAKGIMNFLYDGDVFDQVALRMLEEDPEYWGARLSELDDAVARRIVGQIPIDVD